MLISFEGIDGCGKTTQAHLLHRHLQEQDVASQFRHYPDYDGDVGKHLISPFLRGEFGSVTDVNPWLVGVIFSVDRITSARQLTSILQAGTIVITDRYLLSNIAFQGAKVADPVERRQLQQWIRHFETSQGVPTPTRTFFLDLPVQHAHQRTSAAGDDRTYLAGGSDIHEGDPDLQRAVADEYRQLAADDPATITRIDCVSPAGHRKSPDEVAREVWRTIVTSDLLDVRV